MPKKLPKLEGPIERAETPLPPKAEPNRIILKRTLTSADGTVEKTIDLITVRVAALRACLKRAGVSEEEWNQAYAEHLADFERFRAVEYPKAEEKSRVREMLRRLEDPGAPKQ